jgi:hypothetical protein
VRGYRCAAQITRSAFKRLVGGKWLNDEALNLCVAALVTRYSLHRSEIGVMTTYDLEKWAARTPTAEAAFRCASIIQPWNRRLVLIPIHHNQMHWILAAVHTQLGVIEWYDSMTPDVPSMMRWCRNIISWARAVWGIASDPPNTRLRQLAGENAVIHLASKWFVQPVTVCQIIH